MTHDGLYPSHKKRLTGHECYIRFDVTKVCLFLRTTRMYTIVMTVTFHGSSVKLGFWVPVQNLLLSPVVPMRYMAPFSKVLINNLSFQISLFKLSCFGF